MFFLLHFNILLLILSYIAFVHLVHSALLRRLCSAYVMYMALLVPCLKQMDKCYSSEAMARTPILFQNS